MHKPLISRTAPTGLSFELADLVLLQGWADFHGMQLTVELDHCVEADEYEEVVALYTADNRLRRWILWRSASDIVVQPLIGRSIHFGCVADAIEALVHRFLGSKHIRLRHAACRTKCGRQADD